jgi:dihydroorotate dehydrogenase (NAD+) catalytic subunit
MTPIGNPDLSVSFAGIELKNPVIAASGTFGYGIEFEDIVHLDRLGGFVVKGLSREPMAGNPPPRLYETAAGMLNAIGLQNIGASAFVAEKLPALRAKKNVVVFANVFGYTRADYEHTIEILNQGEGIAAYEINVSCPNTAQGGIHFGSDPMLLDEIVRTAKRIASRPVIVKLSPNVTSIAQMAHIAEEAGADAISLVNTFLAMSIDAETRRPRIANVTAGLSGPAIKPIALRMVYDAALAVKIPVIGIGGISTPADVVEFMLAGASAVQVGTASYFDPVATETLVQELTTYCREQRIERLSDLGGDAASRVSTGTSSRLSAGGVPDRSGRLIVQSFAPHNMRVAAVVDRESKIVAERKTEALLPNITIARRVARNSNFVAPGRSAVA